MRELYYVRHGITDDLAAGIRNRPEATLTEQGITQARAAGELLSNMRVAPPLIVTSSLERAHRTARIIADIIGGNIIASPLLDERWCGMAVGMRNTEIKQRWPGGFDTVPGAEHTASLQQRMRRANAWLDTLEPSPLVAVGHGVAGRALIRHYLGRPYTDEYNQDTKHATNLDNGQVAHLRPGNVLFLPAPEQSTA